MFEPLLGHCPGVTRDANPSWAAFRGRNVGSKGGSRSDGTMFKPRQRGPYFWRLGISTRADFLPA